MVSEHSITPADLKLTVNAFEENVEQEPETIRLEDLEREHILRILRLNKGQMGKTAEKLGITRHTLRYKLARYREEGQ